MFNFLVKMIINLSFYEFFTLFYSLGSYKYGDIVFDVGVLFKGGQ